MLQPLSAARQSSKVSMCLDPGWRGCQLSLGTFYMVEEKDSWEGTCQVHRERTEAEQALEARCWGPRSVGPCWGLGTSLPAARSL